MTLLETLNTGDRFAATSRSKSRKNNFYSITTMEMKQYTAPKVEVNEMGTMAIIATSKTVKSLDSGGVFTGGIGGGSSTAARGNGRRDAWSNGWDE